MPPRFAEVIGPEPRSLADVGTSRLREPVVGVAPFNREAAGGVGRGGRAVVRAVLYMATLAATKWNPIRG